MHNIHHDMVIWYALMIFGGMEEFQKIHTYFCLPLPIVARACVCKLYLVINKYKYDVKKVYNVAA